MFSEFLIVRNLQIFCTFVEYYLIDSSSLMPIIGFEIFCLLK